MTLNLEVIEQRVANCATYNFGMHAANLLAKKDIPALIARIRELEAVLSHVEVDRDFYAGLAKTGEHINSTIKAHKATIQRVREMHKPMAHNFMPKYCQCGDLIPCRTVRVLDGTP